nr:MAG: coat protein [Leviviridae sp.]
MLGNTLVLPYGAGGYTLVKINQDGYSSEYLFRDATRQITARIRHTKTKASSNRPQYDRHNVEVVEIVFATAEVAQFERKFYWVLEQLPSDLSDDVAVGLCTLTTAESAAFLASVLGWES